MRSIAAWALAIAVIAIAAAVLGVHAVDYARSRMDATTCDAGVLLPIPVVNCNPGGWWMVADIWGMAIALAVAGYGLSRAIARRVTGGGRLLLGIQALLGLGLTFLPFALSVDPYLYVTYGRLLGLHNINPYLLAGPIPAGDDAILRQCFTAVFNPPYPDPYGRLWTLGAAELSRLESGLALGAQVWTYRLCAVAAALAVSAGLLRILRERSEAERLLGVGLFAFNPLTMFESAVGGHNDFLMLASAVWGFALAEEMPLVAGLLVGAAISVKFVALAIVPFAAIAAGRDDWRKGVGLALVALGTGALSFPALWSQSAGAHALAAQGSVYGMSPLWLVGLILEAVKAPAMLPSVALTVQALAALIIVVSAVRYALRRSHSELWRSVAALMLALPLIHPWYGAWLLPAAAFGRRWGAFAWSLAVFLFLRYPLEVVASSDFSVGLKTALTVAMFACPMLIAFAVSSRAGPSSARTTNPSTVADR